MDFLLLFLTCFSIIGTKRTENLVKDVGFVFNACFTNYEFAEKVSFYVLQLGIKQGTRKTSNKQLLRQKLNIYF